MSIKKDKRIDGEYDPPLPERPVKPSENDREKLKKILEEHPNLKHKYKHLL